jgi:hypothetical protein
MAWDCKGNSKYMNSKFFIEIFHSFYHLPCRRF